jgi:hypothetical protein
MGSRDAGLSLPPAMSAVVMTYQTVVIWDAPMGHAIAAGPLGLP